MSRLSKFLFFFLIIRTWERMKKEKKTDTVQIKAKRSRTQWGHQWCRVVNRNLTRAGLLQASILERVPFPSPVGLPGPGVEHVWPADRAPCPEGVDNSLLFSTVRSHWLRFKPQPRPSHEKPRLACVFKKRAIGFLYHFNLHFLWAQPLWNNIVKTDTGWEGLEETGLCQRKDQSRSP